MAIAVEDVSAIVEAIRSLPEWKFLEALMAEKEAEGQVGPMQGGPMPTDAAGTVGAGLPEPMRMQQQRQDCADLPDLPPPRVPERFVASRGFATPGWRP